jgi:hypothetical protein
MNNFTPSHGNGNGNRDTIKTIVNGKSTPKDEAHSLYLWFGNEKIDLQRRFRVGAGGPEAVQRKGFIVVITTAKTVQDRYSIVAPIDNCDTIIKVDTIGCCGI